MRKYLIKGTYTYKVQKIIMADSEEDAMATYEAGDVEPLCEWDSQEQDTYHEQREMNKEDFLNDLEKCINGWWDSLPPEIQDDINALYDKRLDAELDEQKQIGGNQNG